MSLFRSSQFPKYFLPLQTRACEFVSDSANLFSSSQCLGYRNEHGELTEELCRPSEEVIVKKLRRVVKDTKAR